MKKRFPRFIWLAVVLFVLAGCAPVINQDQPVVSPSQITISGNQVAGQTFTPHQDGLLGIDLYLQPILAGSGKVNLRLFASQVGNPFSGEILAESSISLSDIPQPGWYRFTFTPLQHTNMQDYAFSLVMIGDGQVAIGTAPGNSYLEGSAYLGNTPADDAQLAFRTIYRTRWLVEGLLLEGLVWIAWLAIALFAFVLPGWAILSGLWSGWRSHNWGEKLGLSIGLSLAIYPILLLWTDLIGLHLGFLYAWVPPVIASLFLVWKNRKALALIISPRRQQPAALSLRFTIPWKRIDFSQVFYLLSFAFIVVLTFVVRFFAVRTISLPMWGDSYQHTLIAQLIVNNQGLFESWQPLAALQTLTYHFGFHTSVAIFHWLTNLDVAQAVLWFGQILNGLAVIALYPLAVRISGGKRWAGIIAMLVGGLISPLPMIYANWGRYTQLDGQTILPTAICLCWGILENPLKNINLKLGGFRRVVASLLADWRSFVPAGLAMAGLALTHYRILIFAVFFFPIYLVFELRKANWKPLLARLAALTFISGLLALPWLLRSYGSSILKNLTNKISTPVSSISSATLESNTIPSLSAYFPLLLWLLFGLAVAWSLWKGSRKAALFSAWWFIILLATNPAWLHLPGTGVISNFALLIAVYLPAAILIGAAVVNLQPIERSSIRTWSSLFALLMVFSLGVWGAKRRLNDISTAPNALAVRPDIRAAVWIDQNTPQDAGFLVSSFFAYGGSSIVGADGGWWVPYLADRLTSLPPITYSAEKGPRPDYLLWINALQKMIDEKSITDPSVLAELKTRGLSYVYIGQRQGQVNNPNPMVLDPIKLSSDPHFKTVYHQDRVWIFEVLPE